MIKLKNVKVTAELLEQKKAILETNIKTFHESRDSNPQVVKVATIWAAELSLIESILESMAGSHVSLRCMI